MPNVRSGDSSDLRSFEWITGHSEKALLCVQAEANAGRLILVNALVSALRAYPLGTNP